LDDFEMLFREMHDSVMVGLPNEVLNPILSDYSDPSHFVFFED